jgi:hypothetical protein
MKIFYLRDLAHSRAGDKGDTSNISVIPYHQNDYPLILTQITAEKVKKHFKDLVKGDVVRYELPNVCALNFVLYNALGGGVTRSLSLDPHGKSYSALMLTMQIEVPEDRSAQLEMQGRKPIY